MIWNWQQGDWCQFTYQSALLEEFEARFLRQSGILLGAYKHVRDDEKNILKIELLGDEALKTSAIEGEYLDRDSVQSSLRRNFGLDSDNRKIPPAEQGIAEMMVDLFTNFADPLSHRTLFNWHKTLTRGRRDLKDSGRYRTHAEPMQIVSGPVGNPKIHFEAPPSTNVPQEMERYIDWFNRTAPGGETPLRTLIRAGVAHLYFVSIHPFEDGNGRVGRAIAVKVLSQSSGQPTLIALSRTIERKKKTYYDMLERGNKANEISEWLKYFAETILEAQQHTQTIVDFIIEKAKFYDNHRDRMNARQEKVVARIFRAGSEGFVGGLNAENYLRITGTSRATATRDLQDLVEKGLLLRTGALKSTRYYLNIGKAR
ncbi:MAG: Fic family protein [Pseudomonadota bacterium]